LSTTTSTQLGAVINDPLYRPTAIERPHTYQFLSLQPGVQSTVGADLYYGSSDAGSVSVNGGGRGRANNFTALTAGDRANDLFVKHPHHQTPVPMPSRSSASLPTPSTPNSAATPALSSMSSTKSGGK